MSISVTILLPTYNEAENICQLIKAVQREVKKSNWKVSFHVIDDNSPDKTAQLVKKTFKGNKNITVSIRTKERGLATAARYGIEHCSTDYFLFMATDFNHDPKYVPQMLKLATDNPNATVNGSRFLRGGGMARADHFYGSVIFNKLGKIILGCSATDYTGVFILGKTTLVKKLDLDWIFRGHGEWGIRLLYTLHTQGKPILEIPVFYPHRPAGDSKTKRSTYGFKLTRAFLETRFRQT